MTEFDRKVEEASARFNRSVANIAETLEKETAELVTYLNDEVVPAVRTHSSKALRTAAGKLAEFADFLETAAQEFLNRLLPAIRPRTRDGRRDSARCHVFYSFYCWAARFSAAVGINLRRRRSHHRLPLPQEKKTSRDSSARGNAGRGREDRSSRQREADL